MRAALLAACAVAAAIPGSALAAARPLPGHVDPRIRTVGYDPAQVVELDGYFGFQTTIAFGEEERIENVSIGDSTAWQITPNRRASLLFIKPVEKGSPTNLTVVTDRHRYAFELICRGAPRRRTQVAYVVQFTYPAAPASPPAEQTAPPRPPERKNTAYTYTGSRTALPSLVFDDGRFTYFQWPEDVSTPAVFVVQPDGSEGLVNYGVRDGYQIIEQTAPRFVLRNGKEVTVVINNGWRDAGPGPLAPRPADAKTARSAAHAEGRP